MHTCLDIEIREKTDSTEIISINDYQKKFQNYLIVDWDVVSTDSISFFWDTHGFICDEALKATEKIVDRLSGLLVGLPLTEEKVAITVLKASIEDLNKFNVGVRVTEKVIMNINKKLQKESLMWEYSIFARTHREISFQDWIDNVWNGTVDISKK